MNQPQEPMSSKDWAQMASVAFAAWRAKNSGPSTNAAFATILRERFNSPEFPNERQLRTVIGGENILTIHDGEIYRMLYQYTVEAGDPLSVFDPRTFPPVSSKASRGGGTHLTARAMSEESWQEWVDSHQKGMVTSEPRAQSAPESLPRQSSQAEVPAGQFSPQSQQNAMPDANQLLQGLLMLMGSQIGQVAGKTAAAEMANPLQNILQILQELKGLFQGVSGKTENVSVAELFSQLNAHLDWLSHQAQPSDRDAFYRDHGETAQRLTQMLRRLMLPDSKAREESLALTNKFNNKIGG